MLVSSEKLQMLVLGEIFSFCHLSLGHHKFYDEWTKLRLRERTQKIQKSSWKAVSPLWSCNLVQIFNDLPESTNLLSWGMTVRSWVVIEQVILFSVLSNNLCWKLQITRSCWRSLVHWWIFWWWWYEPTLKTFYFLILIVKYKYQSILTKKLKFKMIIKRFLWFDSMDIHLWSGVTWMNVFDVESEYLDQKQTTK